MGTQGLQTLLSAEQCAVFVKFKEALKVLNEIGESSSTWATTPVNPKETVDMLQSIDGMLGNKDILAKVFDLTFPANFKDVVQTTTNSGTTTYYEDTKIEMGTEAYKHLMCCVDEDGEELCTGQCRAQPIGHGGAEDRRARRQDRR